MDDKIILSVLKGDTPVYIQGIWTSLSILGGVGLLLKKKWGQYLTNIVLAFFTVFMFFMVYLFVAIPNSFGIPQSPVWFYYQWLSWL